jgi:hypothetical protein
MRLQDHSYGPCGPHWWPVKRIDAAGSGVTMADHSMGTDLCDSHDNALVQS